MSQDEQDRQIKISWEWDSERWELTCHCGTEIADYPTDRIRYDPRGDSSFIPPIVNQLLAVRYVEWVTVETVYRIVIEPARAIEPNDADRVRGRVLHALREWMTWLHGTEVSVKVGPLRGSDQPLSAVDEAKVPEQADDSGPGSDDSEEILKEDPAA